jgi:hypothetical protein
MRNTDLPIPSQTTILKHRRSIASSHSLVFPWHLTAYTVHTGTRVRTFSHITRQWRSKGNSHSREYDERAKRNKETESDKRSQDSERGA